MPWSGKNNWRICKKCKIHSEIHKMVKVDYVGRSAFFCSEHAPEKIFDCDKLESQILNAKNRLSEGPAPL